MLGIAGFMLADRVRHKRRPPVPSEPLRQCVESSLAEVEHQIWLLRNVLWWYLLPLALSASAFHWPSRLAGTVGRLVDSAELINGGRHVRHCTCRYLLAEPVFRPV